VKGRCRINAEERRTIRHVKSRSLKRPHVGGVRLVEEDGELTEHRPRLADRSDDETVLNHLDQTVSQYVELACPLTGDHDAIASVVGRDG